MLQKPKRLAEAVSSRGLLPKNLENINDFMAIWRKGWDSNPRGSVNPLAVFKTAALNHSATLPALEYPVGAMAHFARRGGL
jgi:hypothetical protein